MVSITLDLPPEITPEEARLLLALKLLETKRVSIGTAARVAGYSKAAFMEIASKNGVAVFDYPPGDLERELDL